MAASARASATGSSLRPASVVALLAATAIASFFSRHAFPQSAPTSGTPEARATAYLVAEVPRWRREHPCYSCHNNGDAARALIAAERRGLKVGAAMQDTLAWLGQPASWDSNAQGGGGFDDKPLARIQFAGALTSAVEAGVIPHSTLIGAANIIVADQQEDGSWRLDNSQSVGSPATYGTALATWSARRTLVATHDDRFAAAIGRADRWLRTVDPKNMLDSASVVLGLADARDDLGLARRAHALELLAGGQAPDGGWGLYATSPSEPFDTAVVLLALAAVPDEARSDRQVFQRRITRGRSFLIGKQLPDGSWPETTRPAGQESYAQRISTTGWALLALLESSN